MPPRRFPKHRLPCAQCFHSEGGEDLYCACNDIAVPISFLRRAIFYHISPRLVSSYVAVRPTCLHSAVAALQLYNRLFSGCEQNLTHGERHTKCGVRPGRHHAHAASCGAWRPWSLLLIGAAASSSASDGTATRPGKDRPA